MALRLQKITFGAGPTSLTFSVPARPWVPGTVGVGAGIEWSAAGVPAAWITRRDRTLTITQRFTEDQWPAVLAWLEDAQQGNAFSWFPDSTAGTSHTCYLVSPTIDEDVRPQRGEYFGEMSLTYTIRRTDGALIDEDFFS